MRILVYFAGRSIQVMGDSCELRVPRFGLRDKNQTHPKSEFQNPLFWSSVICRLSSDLLPFTHDLLPLTYLIIFKINIAKHPAAI